MSAPVIAHKPLRELEEVVAGSGSVSAAAHSLGCSQAVLRGRLNREYAREYERSNPDPRPKRPRSIPVAQWRVGITEEMDDQWFDWYIAREHWAKERINQLVSGPLKTTACPHCQGTGRLIV